MTAHEMRQIYLCERSTATVTEKRSGVKNNL